MGKLRRRGRRAAAVCACGQGRLFAAAVAGLVACLLAFVGLAGATTAVAAAGASGYPVTLRDDLGRTVTLTGPARRIVSLAPSNTEILFAIGAGDQVVGVTDFCDFPPEVNRLPRVGGMLAGTVSLERIVSLKPDLVLTVGSLQRPVVQALEQLGLTVFAVDSTSFEHLYENLRKVGQLTGHGEGALRVIDQMRRRVAWVRQRLADLPPERRLRVFYQVWDEPLMTAGPRTFIGQVLELAGGVNVFADVDQDWPQVSLEEVVRRQPDVILGPRLHGGRPLLERLHSRPGWNRLKAVQEGRVYAVDENLISRPGPRLAEALVEVAAVLYPERFAPAPTRAGGSRP